MRLTEPALLPRRRLLRRLSGGAVLWTTLVRPEARALSVNRRPLILLDPGHGGHDPGAIGRGGTLEKDVALSSARELMTTLAANGRYRVAMTRTGDRYLGLDQRVDLAREQQADLFLSLHADIDREQTLRGASVYTLAARASDSATAALAARENGGTADDATGPALSGILASLAARADRLDSARLARQLVRDLEPEVTVLPSPERRANFTVLHAAGIPSVLIEMGFLSNPDDEAALNDAGHRAAIAHAVGRALDAWFARPNRAVPD
jgi:N-acetylmuramoyl-L-alanine amidase